jgi:cyclopropane fatty-acyl-phospholipid synthase-like methyltransferase
VDDADVSRTLDALFSDRGGDWWSAFFTDRAEPCPFLVDRPDENLVSWFGEGLLAPGRVLELGCGNGRNAVHLASLGCTVDAVDFSEQAIDWASGRAMSAGVTVTLQCCSIFDATIAEGRYDLVYDSGCFHHLPPHRRRDYFDLVCRALKPGGSYGLVCFRPEGGSGYTDQQVYERASLGGGLGYAEERLRALWDTAPFQVRELRQMRKTDAQGPCFGEDFLWVLLAAKERANTPAC